MTLKEELFGVLAEENMEQFSTFIHKFQSRSQLTDLEEVLGSLEQSKATELWECVQKLLTSALLSLEDNEEEHNEQEEMKMNDLLQSTVTLATAYLAAETSTIPEFLFEVAVILHGVLPSLPDTADKLKNAMAKLFESWWRQELDGKEELGIQTLIFLLERSLQHKGTAADVKRVCLMRDALKHVDINSPNSEHLKGLFQQCFLHVQYLKQEEGRRFLSSLFSLGPGVLESFHKTIKNQLPTAPRSLLESYGEVYFRAWRVASGPTLEKLEVHCIQDLMYHAVHAGRQSSKSLAHVLRKVLGYFHKQKKHRGVDEMLLRLYEPILWRSLKVANGSVRANSAALLVDTFPLQNPEANVEETDMILQKQFDILQELLLDPCADVRTVTVLGVCRIISVYWEVIPQTIIRTLVMKLFQDIIYDMSSAEVRVVVIKGLMYLLDNHLCHPLLKSLLPTLRDFIHDSSEKVRLAMLELLLKVKGMRAITFWSIVPMDHLLTRLEMDTAPIGRRIVRLVFNSFVPMDKHSDVQLSRAIALIQSNPGAARQFYQYAQKHMTLSDTVKYVVQLCRCVLGCVREESKRTMAADKSVNSSQTEEEEDREEEDSKKENGGGDGNEDLTIHNTTVMVGMLEAMAILWKSISTELDKEGNVEIKKGLQRKFAIAMPEFLNIFKDSEAYSALVLLCGFMPPQLVPHLSRSCLSRLKDMTDESGTRDYGILLEAMCNWGKMADLMELISDWLEDGLKIIQASEPTSSTVKAKRKEKKSVAFTEPRTPQPKLAIDYLSSLMLHPVCRDLLLSNCRPSLLELSEQLKTVMKCLERRFVSPDSLGPRTSDEFLTKAFVMYQKLEIILHTPEDKNHNAVSTMEQLYSWADVQLLSALRDNSLDENSEDTNSRKRKSDQDQTEALERLALQLVESLLVTGSNMLLVGVGDQEFSSQFTDFCSLCLCSGHHAELLPLVAQALYQLTEHWRVFQHESDDGVGSHCSVMASLFSKFLQSLAAYINNDDEPSTPQDRERVDKLLSSMKATVMEVLQAVYRCQQTDEQLVPDIIASVMASVVTDLTFHSKLGTLDQEELCESLPELPALSAFLLTIICKKNYMAKSFSQELYQCIRSGALMGLNALNGVVYLTSNLCKLKPSLSGLKDCVESLQVQVDHTRAEIETYNEDSPDRLLFNCLEASLKKTQDNFLVA